MEIFKLTEKAESKYRPVATISQIEIAPHAPVVLVGECLPQTLLYTLRAIFGCAAIHSFPFSMEASQTARRYNGQA